IGLRDRGIKTGNHLHVIRETKMIAILTEGFFMDSLTDKVAREDIMLKKQGYAIADGIAEYHGVKLDTKESNTSNSNKGSVLKMEQYKELKKEIEELKKQLNNKDAQPANWAKDSWQFGKDSGLTDGTRPHGFITRQESIIMLHRLYN